MKMLRRTLGVLLFLIYIIEINEKTFATDESMTYQAKYESAISYKVTIKGLEEENEDYIYAAIISKNLDITEKDFFKAQGPSFGLNYDQETKEWTGSTKEGEFEEQGQYYIYVAKLKKGSTHYEMIEGPTKIATSELPSLGERIKIYVAPTGTNYFINVNALNTYGYRKVERKIRFYLGEITDEVLLEKLEQKGTKAYNELLVYAKKQKEKLKEDSFKDNSISGVLDYNIVQDYPIETGKYYFLYIILDDENGTYVEVEDIAAYNGYKSQSGVGLEKFKYEKLTNDTDNIEKPTNQITNQIVENMQYQNFIVNQIDQQTDNTIALDPIPQTGSTIIKTIVFFSSIVFVIMIYCKYREYKNVK